LNKQSATYFTFIRNCSIHSWRQRGCFFSEHSVERMENTQILKIV